jgi:hypothetical protein
MGRDQPRASLPPMNDLKHLVLNQVLDPKNGLPYAARAVIRTQVGLSSETNAPPAAAASTDGTSASTLTNAAAPVEANSAGSTAK